MSLHHLPFLPRIGAVLALAAALASPAHAIVGGTSTTAFQAVGTGVQVTPDWVATVQHAAPNVGGFYNNGYGQRVVLARFDAPGSGTFPNNDLSLLQLSPIMGTIPYLLVAADSFPIGTFAAMAVTISSPLNPLGDGNPRGYGRTNVTEFARILDEGSGPMTVNYLLSYDTTVHVQGGDSGGGLFYGQVTDQTSPLLGLSSALLEDTNFQPIGSGFVLLSAYRPWIDATLAANGIQTIRWVTAVPEPATWVLWAAGLAGLGAMTRRRAA